MTEDISALFSIFLFGSLYAIVACIAGLLMPVLWPRVDHAKANTLLTAVYYTGLCIMCFAAVSIITL